MTQHIIAPPSQASKVNLVHAADQWQKGKTAREIGDYFGVTKNVIVSIAKRNRELFPSKVTKTNDGVEWRDLVDVSLMAEMWAAEKTMGYIASYFGVYAHNVEALANEDRKMFPKRKRGWHNLKGGKKPSTPQQRVERVKRESAEYASSLFFTASLSRYDTERLVLGKILADIGKNECRWPIGEARPFVFCAAEAKGVYCTHHHLRSPPRAA